MTKSEDHTACWVHKNLTVTTKQIQALLTYWMGTEISRLGGYGFRGTVTAGGGSKREESGSRSCEPAGKKEKAAKESGTRRGRIQLEPSGTSGLCLSITRHPCDNPHALFVQKPSAAQSCKKMGRRSARSGLSSTTAARHLASTLLGGRGGAP